MKCRIAQLILAIPCPVFIEQSFSYFLSLRKGFISHCFFSELPQLRSLTSEELGCDARGYSRAGHDTLTWYCVILAGRLGPELDSMREVSFSGLDYVPYVQFSSNIFLLLYLPPHLSFFFSIILTILII